MEDYFPSELKWMGPRPARMVVHIGGNISYQWKYRVKRFCATKSGKQLYTLLITIQYCGQSTISVIFLEMYECIGSGNAVSRRQKHRPPL